jgi:hypothetical protein
MDTSDDDKPNFFKHVFNFDDSSKAEILNIIQYALLAIIPIIILNKSMSKYVPEADEQKGSLEISAELIIQVIIIFIGLLIIHRIITFIPTFSKTEYPDFSIIYIILAILMITMSLQTKIGEKVNILVERITELWEGKTNTKKKTGKNNVKVSQPISGQNISSPISNPNSQIYTDGTAISSLPITQSQQLPNYNNMYQQDNTPLVGAATPGQQTETFMGPMAANEAFGSSFGSSW